MWLPSLIGFLFQHQLTLHIAAKANFQKQNWLNTFKTSPLLRRKILKLIIGSFINWLKWPLYFHFLLLLPVHYIPYPTNLHINLQACRTFPCVCVLYMLLPVLRMLSFLFSTWWTLLYPLRPRSNIPNSVISSSILPDKSIASSSTFLIFLNIVYQSIKHIVLALFTYVCCLPHETISSLNVGIISKSFF